MGHSFRIEALSDERMVATPLMDVHLVAVALNAFLTRYGRPKRLADLVTKHQLILPSYVNIPRISRLLGPVVGNEPAEIAASHSATSEAAIPKLTRTVYLIARARTHASMLRSLFKDFIRAKYEHNAS